MSATDSLRQPESIQIDDDLEPRIVDEVLEALMGGPAAAFLPSRRWYGHKQQLIASIRLVDRAIASVGGDLFALCFVRIEFRQGKGATYFLPLAFSEQAAEPASVIAVVTAPNGRWSVVDAPTSPFFRRWLAEILLRQGTLPGLHGQFEWIGQSERLETFPKGDVEESRVVAAEQSNTSIIYGRSAILKMFRQIRAGTNPDAEISRFLTERTTFGNVPPFLGELRYTDAAGDASSLAVAQGYVDNQGDGWSFALSVLAPAQVEDVSVESTFVDDARKLGLRTAQMHVALAGERGDQAMRPEPISDEDVEGWTGALVGSLKRVDQTLAAARPFAPGDTAELIDAFKEAIDGLRSRTPGFELLIGASKTRVHGDYHLGQTLRTLDGDFVILDFEGEPQRTIEERRAKTSPLKDVAGMLRSFGYARGAAAREHATGGTATPADLVAWERATRDAFLAAYFEAASAARASFLPSSWEDFREALVPWELDKALYEIEYEVRNRPDWLWLPLTATLKLA